MGNPDDVELVRRAIISHTTGDCEWEEREAERFRPYRYLQGLTPEYIRTLLQDHVREGGRIDRRVERRPEYDYRDYWYRVIIPLTEFRHGLFVEIILVDEDPEAPAVQIVNAHE
jgi:hypothetical protein